MSNIFEVGNYTTRLSVRGTGLSLIPLSVTGLEGWGPTVLAITKVIDESITAIIARGLLATPNAH